MPHGVSLLITACVRFWKFLVRKTALFWVQIPAPKWVRFLPPLIHFVSRGRKPYPFRGRNLYPKRGRFSDQEFRKLRAPAMSFSDRANQPWSRLLATPHCFSHMERSGGPSRSAARRQGQEVSSGLPAFWRRSPASHVGTHAQWLVRHVCSCPGCSRQPRWSHESRRAQAAQRHSR